MTNKHGRRTARPTGHTPRQYETTQITKSEPGSPVSVTVAPPFVVERSVSTAR